MDQHEQLTHDEGAAATLRRIAAGGNHLLMITRRRIAEVLDALDAGDFRRAANAMGEAQQTIMPLANAQTYIAIADNAELMEMGTLEVGMVIVDVGVVEAVDIENCGAMNCPGHVKVKVGEHDLSFRATDEVYIQREPPGPSCE